MQNTIILVVLITIGVILVLGSVMMAIRAYTPTVKAGRMDDFAWRYDFSTPRVPEKITFNGHEYDTADYTIKVIRGESMRYYGLHDRYIAFIHPYTDEEKSHISGYPTIELDVVYAKNPWLRSKVESKTKLRKFITYISIDDQWEKIYEQHKDRIHLDDIKDFETDFNKGIKRMQGCQEGLVLSETYDKEKGRNHYSIHAVSTIRGKVDFVYPTASHEKTAA